MTSGDRIPGEKSEFPGNRFPVSQKHSPARFPRNTGRCAHVCHVNMLNVTVSKMTRAGFVFGQKVAIFREATPWDTKWGSDMEDSERLLPQNKNPGARSSAEQ